MNERLKELRAYLKLSTREFSDRLGMSNGAISLLESGKRSLTQKFIKSVCREFGVSYEWLTTGEGDMLVPKDRSTEIADLTERLMSGEPEQLRKAFANVLCGMTEAQIIALYDVAKKTVEEVEKSLKE